MGCEFSWEAVRCGHSHAARGSGTRRDIAKMTSDHRIVTRLPLAELWDERGTFAHGRARNLTGGDVKELLRAREVRFVVADCGLKLDWMPANRTWEFWRNVKPAIADPRKPIILEEFPGEAAYTASEWRGRDGECLIVLEKHH